MGVLYFCQLVWQIYAQLLADVRALDLRHMHVGKVIVYCMTFGALTSTIEYTKNAPYNMP